MKKFSVASQTRKSGYFFKVNSEQGVVKVTKTHYKDSGLDAVKYLTINDARKFYKLLQEEEHEKFGAF